MGYLFLFVGELHRDRLATALAGLLSVPVESVDVGDEDDDDRNWSAPVSCTVTALAGDFRWHLDVYLGEAIRNPPPEPAAAAWLARSLGTVVGYSAVPEPPSAYWLVGPDGRRTRARIYEEDTDEASAFRIDAVERPLTALPGLPVAPLPEVIRSYRMPTPITDGLRERLGPETAPIRYATTRLAAWEGMVTRQNEDWPPDGWYPVAYYREDLTTRDELESAVAALPEPVREPFRQALAEVDRRFVDATEDDGGRELAAEDARGRELAAEAGRGRELAAEAGAGWWWRRVPHPLPWRNAPR